MVSPVVAVRFVEADGVTASVAAGEAPKYDDDECCTIAWRMSVANQSNGCRAFSSTDLGQQQ